MAGALPFCSYRYSDTGMRCGRFATRRSEFCAEHDPKVDGSHFCDGPIGKCTICADETEASE